MAMTEHSSRLERSPRSSSVILGLQSHATRVRGLAGAYHWASALVTGLCKKRSASLSRKRLARHSVPMPRLRRRPGHDQLLLQPVAQEALTDVVEALVFVVADDDDDILLVLHHAVQPGEFSGHHIGRFGDPGRILAAHLTHAVHVPSDIAREQIFASRRQ